MSIATNLYTALLSLRSTSTGRSGPCANPWDTQYAEYLWIDALCINQADHQERNSQVMMMSRIYQQAHVVFVWLGGEGQSSINAIVDLANIGNMPHECFDFRVAVDMMRPLKIDDEQSLHQLGLPIINRDSWINIYMFLNRSWFKRAWIVQEIAFSKEPIFICGPQLFGLDSLMKSLNVLNETRWMKQIVDMGIPLIQNYHNEDERELQWQQAGSDIKLYRPRRTNSLHPYFTSYVAYARLSVGTPTEGAEFRKSANSDRTRMLLLHLLSLYWSSEATDARDKVYAFIGMSREQEELESQATIPRFRLSVDYQTEVRDVYI